MSTKDRRDSETASDYHSHCNENPTDDERHPIETENTRDDALEAVTAFRSLQISGIVQNDTTNLHAVTPDKKDGNRIFDSFSSRVSLDFFEPESLLTGGNAASDKQISSGRSPSPPASCQSRALVSLNIDRPPTCTEEAKDELSMLRTLTLDMHKKLMEARKCNKHLLNQLRTKEASYKEVVDKMRSRYEERFGTFRDKAILLVNKCEHLIRERAAAEEEIDSLRTSWLHEKQGLESKLETLKFEVQRSSVGHESSSTESECVNLPTTLYKSEDYSLVSHCPDKEESHDSHVQGCPPITADESIVDHWDDLYRILYEISLNKLIVLENQQEARAKDELNKSLIEYGHLNIFGDLFNSTNNDLNSESNCTLPEDSNSYSENVLMRRSSSCPQLAELGDTMLLMPESVGYKCTEEVESADNSLRGVGAKFATQRPMSIPLTCQRSDDFSYLDDPSSSSPSPDQELRSTSQTFNVFSRQKLIYRHVCRQPRRTVSEKQDNASGPEMNTTNSLPIGTHTSNLEECLSRTPNHDAKWSHKDCQDQGNRVPIQSNFERLCHRRNGLINPEFKYGRVGKVRQINVIDKLGLNLRSIRSNKE